MRTHYVLATTLVVAALSGPVRAFGGAGHEAVCEIAFLELTGTARAELLAIMEHEPRVKFQPFHAACTWPDSTGNHPHKAERTERRNDGSHFINVARDVSKIEDAECTEADVCLFTAIAKDRATLESDSASDRDKVIALKFLGHWLGDLHQPLHISYADDRGGNRIKLKQSIGCPKKLHAVWDTCIPHDLMGEPGIVQDDRQGFGAELHSEITDEQRAEWTESMDLAAWATESLERTRQSNVRYCTTRSVS